MYATPWKIQPYDHGDDKEENPSYHEISSPGSPFNDGVSALMMIAFKDTEEGKAARDWCVEAAEECQGRNHKGLSCRRHCQVIQGLVQCCTCDPYMRRWIRPATSKMVGVQGGFSVQHQQDWGQLFTKRRDRFDVIRAFQLPDKTGKGNLANEGIADVEGDIHLGWEAQVYSPMFLTPFTLTSLGSW